MKRRIYFLGSAIIQIIAAVLSIVFANKIIANLLSQINYYPVTMQQRINDLFNNSGHVYIVLVAIFVIIFNGLIIYWSYQDILLKRKGSVIAASVFSLLVAMYPVSELFAIINIIVLLASKRTRAEDFPDKVREMPKIDKEIVNKNKIILAIILICIYFSQFLWSGLIPKNGIIKYAVGASFYLLMIVLSLVFFRDLFRDNFKVFKKNFIIYVQNLKGTIGKFYLLYFGVAFITIFLSNADTSINQSNVEALPIWYSFPLAVIYAPIVEETLFRGCIRRFIKNDRVFIVISAISFGLLHTIFSEVNLYNALVLAIPYMTIGGCLAYLYVKTNNMFTNMSFHAFHNTLAMIITILIKGI